MIRVRIDLEDTTGSWRIIRIIVDKDGTDLHVSIGNDQFRSRFQAEREAKMRARFFLMENYGTVPEGEIVWETWPPGPSESNPLA